MLVRSHKRSIVAVLLPLILAGATAVILSMYVLYVAASQSDAIVLEQQESLISKVLAKQVPEVVRNQKSVAVWDDAIQNGKEKVDLDWLDANLGIWMHDFFGLDETFVLNDRNVPVYAMVDGKRAAPASFAGVAAALAPMIADLRASVPYKKSDGDDPAHSAGLVKIAGRPALASVMPILSDTGKIEQESGSEYLDRKSVV